MKLLEAGSVYLGDVRFVAVDEVDTMFEAGFGPELDKARARVTSHLTTQSANLHACSIWKQVSGLGNSPVEHTQSCHC